MNLREGMRRLALLLGAAGAIFAGFLSYAQLQSTLRQRDGHVRFEKLANSSVIKQARKECFDSDAPSETATTPKHTTGDAPSQHGPWEKYQTSQKNTPPETLPGDFFDRQPYCYIPNDDPNATYYTLPKFNTDEIKTVHFENTGIASIETQDGRTAYPVQAPPAQSYILIAFLPVLGFLLPWCAIRAIGWVTTGFAEPTK